MASLNSRLQLALLNRKKGRNLLEKGFTLVELMIVIVIVGVLSAVALPNFLGQQTKAKVTEATSKISGILKAAHAEYTFSGSEDDAITAVINESTRANEAGVYTYLGTNPSGTALVVGTPLAPANRNILIVSAQPNTPAMATASGGSAKSDSQLVDASLEQTRTVGRIYGCINLSNGRIDIAREFRDTVVTPVDGSLTAPSTTVANLDCETA